MKARLNRRSFLKDSIALTSGLALGAAARADLLAPAKQPLFKISLAEWSLHRALFGKKLDHLDFPKAAIRDYGINAIELVNQFFKNKAKDQKYLAEFKKRSEDIGVRIMLIMIDDEGALGDPDPKKRTKAIENHYQWVEAGKFFGCHSIRVNAETKGTGPTSIRWQSCTA